MIVLAGATFGTLALPAAASAQPAHVAHERTVVTHRTVVQRGPGYHRHRVCRTTYYHHRRVRRCA